MTMAARTITEQTPAKVSLKIAYLLLIAILLIGGLLRFARSGTENLSFDEQWYLTLSNAGGSIQMTLPPDVLIDPAPIPTSLQNAQPWYRIWTSLSTVVHPPLYFIVLRAWREMFGTSEGVARSLAILCSLVVIVLIFEAGRKLLGTNWALCAAALFAIAPIQVYMAQQVRGYSMMQMFAAAGLLAVVLLEKSIKPVASALLLGLSALAMMLTHYFAAGAGLALGIYVLVRLRGRARTLAITSLIMAAVLYAVVWGPFAWAQRGAAGDADRWLKDTRPIARLATIVAVTNSAWREFFVIYLPRLIDRNPRTPWPYLSFALFVVPPFFLRRKPALLLPWLWLVCTIGFLAALDLSQSTTHLRYTRYIVLAAPGVCLLVAGLVSLLPRTAGPICMGLILVGTLAASRQIYVVDPLDWSSIGKILDEHSTAGEVVFVNTGGPNHADGGQFYLAAAHYSHSFPRGLVKLTNPASPALLQTIQGQTAWLITPEPAPPAQDLLPGCVVLEQFDASNVAVGTHVKLR